MISLMQTEQIQEHFQDLNIHTAKEHPGVVWSLAKVDLLVQCLFNKSQNVQHHGESSLHFLTLDSPVFPRQTLSSRSPMTVTMASTLQCCWLEWVSCCHTTASSPTSTTCITSSRVLMCMRQCMQMHEQALCTPTLRSSTFFVCFRNVHSV